MYTLHIGNTVTATSSVSMQLFFTQLVLCNWKFCVLLIQVYSIFFPHILKNSGYRFYYRIRQHLVCISYELSFVKICQLVLEIYLIYFYYYYSCCCHRCPSPWHHHYHCHYHFQVKNDLHPASLSILYLENGIGLLGTVFVILHRSQQPKIDQISLKGKFCCHHPFVDIAWLES